MIYMFYYFFGYLGYVRFTMGLGRLIVLWYKSKFKVFVYVIFVCILLVKLSYYVKVNINGIGK